MNEDQKKSEPIEIENKKYDSAEIIEVVISVLNFIADQSESNELEYGPGDLYYTVKNLITYVNRQIKGEFRLRNLKKGKWQITYDTEKLAKRKSDQRAEKEKLRTAEYLDELKKIRRDRRSERRS